FCYPSPCTSSSTASSWLYTLSLHDALPISARTNRIIGGQAPSSYLESVQEEVGVSPAQMDELLHSHAIDPGRLRDDDYFGCRDARSEALISLIEQATGKRILRDQAPLEGEDMGEDLEELLEEITADGRELV